MILVTGAIGTTGREIVKQLVAEVTKFQPITFDQFAQDYAYIFQAK